jgi:branched-chain amino acid transport system substrate-binding protein
VTVPLAGGDALHSVGYLKQARGVKVDGDLASNPGVSVEGLASAFAYLDAYQEAGYKEPAGPYGAYAYDSVSAVVEAVRKARAQDRAATGRALRDAVVEAMQGVRFFGVTGDVAFDEFGDTLNQIASIYQVEGGAWKAVVSYGRVRDF